MGLSSSDATLDVTRTLRGARLVVLGGTGFLGKVFWAMLLDRYPEVERIYLVVRPKGGATPEARFWSDIAVARRWGRCGAPTATATRRSSARRSSPSTATWPARCAASTRRRVRELRGHDRRGRQRRRRRRLQPAARRGHRGERVRRAEPRRADARARDGRRPPPCSTRAPATSRARARDPSTRRTRATHPFPRCGELGVDAWDPDREIAECLDLVAQAKHRADDAFRQSEFAEAARKNLASRGEPVHGPAYETELARVKRRFVSDRLIEAGLDRATHWGWPNIYTYTKSIGEQVIARSGLPFTIARPACCESCVEFPERSYNEGINTSSPLIYLIMKGQTAHPRRPRPARPHPDRLRRRGDDPGAGRAPRGHGAARLPARRERREPLHGAALRRDGRALQAQVPAARRRRQSPGRRPRSALRADLRRRRRSSSASGPPAIASAAREASPRHALGRPGPRAGGEGARERGGERETRSPISSASSSRSPPRSTDRSTARTRGPRTRARPTTTSASSAGRPSRSTGSTG